MQGISEDGDGAECELEENRKRGNKELRLQNILFPPVKSCEEMYLRAFHVPCRQCRPFMVPHSGMIRTDTYMNAFDVGAWKKYTELSKLSLCVSLRGSGIITCFWEREKEEPMCLFKKKLKNGLEGSDKRKFPIWKFEKMKDGVLYFEFRAETDSVIEAWFETDSIVKKNVKLSIIICTYKRQKQLEQMIKILQEKDKQKDFSQPEYETEGSDEWFRTIIVDNASEIENTYGDRITVYHNPNLGGSGGFSRGMEETIRNLPVFEATHVVLMDDDAVLQKESLYRLRALLSFMKPEYEEEAVAGRMFRLDKPWIQYTAAEIWNGGDIRHIGWNRNVTDRQYIWNMNENAGGEYSGWWFACFPIGFVKNNRPLPFFLHCDDVEYGLRHGGTPITLNGIQVWHVTYEYRRSPVMAYYDYRNSLIVNALYGCGETDKKRIWEHFKQKITKAHVRKDYLLEYFLIRAFRDYLKGMKWFMRKDDTKIHEALLRKKRVWKYGNSLRWRIALFRTKEKKSLCIKYRTY